MLCDHTVRDKCLVVFVEIIKVKTCHSQANTSDEDAVNESPLRVVFSFYATTVVGVLEAGPVTKQLVSSLFESIVQGLRSRISDYTSAAYITLAQVVSRSQLKRDLLEPITNIVCKASCHDYSSNLLP